MSFVTGSVVGAGMGAGMHKISSRFSGKNKLTDETPLNAKPNNTESPRLTNTSQTSKILAEVPSNIPSAIKPKIPGQLRNLPNGTEGDQKIALYFETRYGKMPKDPTAALKWYEKVSRKSKKLQDLCDKFIKEAKTPAETKKLDDLKYALMAIPDSNIARGLVTSAYKRSIQLSEIACSGKITAGDLTRGSAFRNEVATCLKIIKKHSTNYGGMERIVMDLEGFRHLFKLRLILYSRPRFVPSNQTGQVVNPNSKKPFLTRENGTSDNFFENVKAGVEAFPPKVRLALRRLGARFSANKEIIDRINGDSGGLAKGGKNLITSELGCQANYLKKPVFGIGLANEYRLATIHEGGHGVDRTVYYLRFLRKLDRAKSIEEFQSILQKIKEPSSGNGLRNILFSNTKEFRTVHLEDVMNMSPTRRKDLWYFINGISDAVKNKTFRGGREEAMAEIITLLYGKHARITHQDFPKTIALVEKVLKRYFG